MAGALFVKQPLLGRSSPRAERAVGSCLLMMCRLRAFFFFYQIIQRWSICWYVSNKTNLLVPNRLSLLMKNVLRYGREKKIPNRLCAFFYTDYVPFVGWMLHNAVSWGTSNESFDLLKTGAVAKAGNWFIPSFPHMLSILTVFPSYSCIEIVLSPFRSSYLHINWFEGDTKP